MDFSNKVVVVTGASKGFGKALAQAFLQEKATVIITSNNEDELKATAEDLGCAYYVADAGSYEECVSLVEYVENTYSTLDIFVNNAGIQIAPSNLEEVSIDKLHRLFSINFFGYFYGCKVALGAMRRAGAGAIININSTAGLGGKAGLSAYVSSKFAIRGMTETLREEVTGSDIKIYQIFPGGMKTDIYHEKVPADIEDYMDVGYAINKMMENFALDEPELDFVIKRPAK